MTKSPKPEGRTTLAFWGLIAVSLTLLAMQLMNPGTMNAEKPNQATQPANPAKSPAGKTELATFGGGCFWCTEAVFERVEGVSSVVSGYSGGQVPNPTYKQICTGETGHAEVIQIAFDPGLVTYEQLLSVFWQSHDPTTLNRQGNDVGTQYRSVIFYHDDAQKAAAEKLKTEEAGRFKRPIVTEISAFSKFYKAEDYHQDYFANNPNNPYCNYFIPPKLDKLQKSGLIK